MSIETAILKLTQPHLSNAIIDLPAQEERSTMEHDLYGISSNTGFLCHCPLRRLSPYFEHWERVCSDLPQLLRDKKLRHEVIQRLPLLEVNDVRLPTEAHWKRAYSLLCYITQGYMWMEGEQGLPSSIPRNLAVPLCTVATRLDMPPILTYLCSILCNWALRNEHAGYTEDNIYSTVSFTGTVAEDWFYTIHRLTEVAATPAVNAIAANLHKPLEAAWVSNCLDQIRKSLTQMEAVIQRMFEKCDPAVFYHQIRPYLAGTMGLETLPEGIVYEGVDEKARKYGGASGAQSSTIPAFTTFLRVQVTGESSEFLDLQRKHMPRPHRHFLDVLAKQPSIREFIQQSADRKLICDYNAALDSLVGFRSQHVILATRYIVNQKSTKSNQVLESTGTGGSNFMPFLKQVRDATLSTKLDLVNS